jgi:hypothetical protein
MGSIVEQHMMRLVTVQVEPMKSSGASGGTVGPIGEQWVQQVNSGSNRWTIDGN